MTVFALCKTHWAHYAVIMWNRSLFHSSIDSLIQAVAVPSEKSITYILVYSFPSLQFIFFYKSFSEKNILNYIFCMCISITHKDLITI